MPCRAVILILTRVNSLDPSIANCLSMGFDKMRMMVRSGQDESQRRGSLAGTLAQILGRTGAREKKKEGTSLKRTD